MGAGERLRELPELLGQRVVLEVVSTLQRDDVTFLGVPLADMCVEHFKGSRTRIAAAG